MKLRTKFNLMLLAAFMLGLGMAGFLANRILEHSAREEVIQNANIMMASAMGAREYTVKQIRPLLALRMNHKFYPQSVSAYAATQNFIYLQEKFPNYSYREAALNPTNLNHRATDWEADIINEFRRDPKKLSLVTGRDTPSGRILYLAQPIQIQDEGCLQCHNTPEDAPKTMLDLYGANHGFGWKLNEVIGAQIVSVPMSVPLQRAQNIFFTFVIMLTAVLLATMILLNIILYKMVITPVLKMEKIANDVSLGMTDVPEYIRQGNDEIASLSASFNRMRRSLKNAMKLLES